MPDLIISEEPRNQVITEEPVTRVIKSLQAGPQGAPGDDGAPGAAGPQGPQGDPGEGVPTGGTTGQVLAKDTNADYDTEWIDAPGGAVDSVNGQTGVVVLDKDDIGLGNVDNTSDLNKPISTATQTALNLKEDTANKGIANGYASLDPGGKVPIAQLPASVMTYLGTWDAATNTPTLANGTGDQGDLYIVSAAGTVNFGASPITFEVGDWVMYNGSIWQRSDMSDAVSSVFGRLGAVVAANGDYTASQVTNVAAGNISAVTVQAAIDELDTEKVAKAGDTMTGTLVVPSLNVNGSSPVTRITVDSANAFSTSLDIVKRGNAGGTGLQTLSGSEIGYHSFYGYTGSAIRRLAYAIVYASGDTTSTTGGGRYLINVRDTAGTEATRFYLDQTGLTIGSTSTIAPTHTLTLPSTATGIALYNTADQTTNYERVRQYWSGNEFTIFSEQAGTGTLRSMRMAMYPSSGFYINGSFASRGHFQFTLATNTVSGQVFSVNGTLSAASGLQYAQVIAPTISQSSTAGYTALLVNPTESATGSGVRNLMDLQVGSTSKFRVSAVNGWVKRVTAITSNATPTINTDNADAVDITALATDITSMTTNLTGTPTNKQTIVFEIKDNGTPRAITWGASFVAGGVALPTTTVANKILTVGFTYSTANGLNKWRCTASVQEA